MAKLHEVGVPITAFVMLGLGAVGLVAGVQAGARQEYRERPARKRRRRGILRGIGPELPLQMAEFVIGQEIGEHPGTIYREGDRSKCRIGADLPRGLRKGDVVDYKDAKNIFLRTRASFLGGEKVAGAGATLIPAQGTWRDPEHPDVPFDEPSFIGQVIWAPGKFEPTPTVFRGQMKKMCEDMACRMGQAQIWLRLYNGDKTTLTKCSPRGKWAPRA